MRINVNDNENIIGTLVLPLWEGVQSLDDEACIGIHRSLRHQIETVLTDGDFKAKSGSLMTLLGTEGGKAILVGLGKDDKADSNSVRNAGAGVISHRKRSHGTDLTVRFHDVDVDLMSEFVEGMILRDYKYDHYKTKKDDGEEEEEDLSVEITCEVDKVDALKAAAELSAQVASGVFLARDLGNCPPNDLYPMAFANKVTEWAKDLPNVNVNIITYDEAISLGMGGLVGVGMGSERKPCMVIFEMNPQKPGPSPCIVGKGITFDTGGISIKPSPSMDEMKYDMHGSATVFGVMQALAATGWEERVVAITCMAENMPSSNALRPGDVITTYSGKTVEVLNTDAEGRLVLSDGLCKAGEMNVSYIIDLATLTGAIVVALGHEATGMWTNDDNLRESLKNASDACDELIWPMPMLPQFEKEMTDSKIADLRNLGAGRAGGSNTAAAFLKQFVPKRGEGEDAEDIPWAHLDIAGTAWGAKSNKLVPHGATGIHVRTLHKLITGQ